MKAKRIAAIVLTMTMLTSLAACSGAGNESSTSGGTSSAIQNSTNDKSSTGENSVSASESNEGSAEENSAETSGRGNSSSSESKTLVVYFSASNTKDVDAVTGATPVQGRVGTVEHIAEIIHNQVGGDIAKIVPGKDYSLDYNTCADEAKAETDSDARPQFEPLSVKIEDYDTIYVGYPMWWYTLPMIMYTFFDTYDFSGKTIIPFNTHAGSGDGGTYQTIKEFEPGATVKDGLAISGSSAFDSSTEDAVKSWLAGLE